MTLIVLSYLATSYAFCGLICSLAFLRAYKPQLSFWKSIHQRVGLSFLALIVVGFWPVWMLWEIYFSEKFTQYVVGKPVNH